MGTRDAGGRGPAPAARRGQAWGGELRAVVCGLAGLLVPGRAAGVGEGRGEPEAFARSSAVRPAGKTELKGLEDAGAGGT
ncbi:unnamed protein product [Rangifer tarandus platyrhynchus]|uniref:Uncharacterized protein n=2 Tax=Rangifer tarandus platyrhynchus TaxID=3082113 RepID=A0ACB0ELL8_RANTA|nr:unnamed protein product [Rangifer tarandus platyrhynchus]CAI9701319.1 unnamed protein product [Rangifer tarandus platyrhynchus]